MCRVFGAIVIVVGLYMVIWGKGKDYYTNTPLDEENAASTQLQCQHHLEIEKNKSNFQNIHINHNHNYDHNHNNNDV